MNTKDEGAALTGFVLHERLLIARVTGKQSHLTVQEFADLIGISRTTLASHEAGRTTPKKPVLESYAAKTGYTLEWLHAGVVSIGQPHPEFGGVVMSTDPVRIMYPDDIPVRG